MACVVFVVMVIFEFGLILILYIRLIFLVIVFCSFGRLGMGVY